MLFTYEELKEMKKMGIFLDWDEISEEQLRKLFVEEHIPNTLIAELYEVSSGMVQSKRRRWGINIYQIKYVRTDYQENKPLVEE